MTAEFQRYAIKGRLRSNRPGDVLHQKWEHYTFSNDIHQARSIAKYIAKETARYDAAVVVEPDGFVNFSIPRGAEISYSHRTVNPSKTTKRVRRKKALKKWRGKKNPRNPFMSPTLKRISTRMGTFYVEDDGHVFAKRGGIGYVGKLKSGTRNTSSAIERLLKNPVRVTKKAKKLAKSLILRYGKPKARRIAGAEIGMAKRAKQTRKKKLFEGARKAINPDARHVKRVWTRRKMDDVWKIACRVKGGDLADVKAKVKEVAGKLAQKGWHVKYET